MKSNERIILEYRNVKKTSVGNGRVFGRVFGESICPISFYVLDFTDFKRSFIPCLSSPPLKYLFFLVDDFIAVHESPSNIRRM